MKDCNPALQVAFAHIVETEARQREADIRLREKDEELRLRIKTLQHIVQTDSKIDVTYYRTRVMQQLTGIPPPPIRPGAQIDNPHPPKKQNKLTASKTSGGKLITLADIVGDGFPHAALLDLAPSVRDWYMQTYGILPVDATLQNPMQTHNQTMQVAQFHAEHEEYIRSFLTRLYIDWQNQKQKKNSKNQQPKPKRAATFLISNNLSQSTPPHIGKMQRAQSFNSAV
eukprot:1373888-Rhodomonas_salina.1